MKVLVAVDSSIFAHQIVQAVGERLWPTEVEFMLLTVVSHCRSDADEAAFTHEAQMILDERAKYLRHAARTHNVTARVEVGHPGEMILSIAKFWQPDVIVLGSHGDTGIRPTRLGSVAEHVVNGAPCSVDIIKVKKDEHFPIKAAHA